MCVWISPVVRGEREKAREGGRSERGREGGRE